MRIAIVGVTGLVGRTILKVIEERKIKIDDFIPVASKSSIGKLVKFADKEFKIVGIEDAYNKKPDIAIFSAGKNLALEWAEKFANIGTYVIDNSSAWRMHNDIKLIVPEINFDSITSKDKIIANPNCSTIQLVMVLNPLHKKYKLKRLVVSTYQSVTGSGMDGINQLLEERELKHPKTKKYPYQIDMNCFPQGGKFLENKYSEEEWKIVNETQKILGIKNLKITATAVRIPVLGGHSESVNIEFFNKPIIKEVYHILNDAKGISIMDDPNNNVYPMPIISKDKDDVFVGRIRQDNSCENGINLWICADNLRKGAGTNAVQIAEKIIEKFLST